MQICMHGEKIYTNIYGHIFFFNKEIDLNGLTHATLAIVAWHPDLMDICFLMLDTD